MTDAALKWEWPFSRSELMAGLRRYLAASSLRLLDIQPIVLPITMPGAAFAAESGTRLSAMSVGVRIDGEDFDLPLVIKQPPVSQIGRASGREGGGEAGCAGPSRRRHTRFSRDWSSDVCSSDLGVTWRPVRCACSIFNRLCCQLPCRVRLLQRNPAHG